MTWFRTLTTPKKDIGGNLLMPLHRRTLLATGTGTAVAAAIGHRARAQANTIRIGLLTDFSGPYRDINGPTSVVCAKRAISEFAASNPSINVELISADHQNKTDSGTTILRGWFDREKVDMVLNITNSAVALACNSIVTEKDKVCVNTSAGTSALTGTACTPNAIQWTYDTWNLAHSTATQVVKAGGDKWFFVTPNYVYGKALQADATKFVEASGGKVLGAATFPFPETTDFSSFIVQAASSGANAVAFATGGNDLVNFMKQARMAGMTGFITDVLAMGPTVAQGLTLTENFYWDLNDRTRAFYNRVKPKLDANVFPCSIHAGDYAGTWHYLKAVKEMGVAQAKASGKEVVAMMKKIPTDDDCFGLGRVREDGRKIHPAYLFEVKKPAEITAPGAIYKHIATTPIEEAFRPLSEGGCPLVRT
jgi:branched-chain amino acid transport system substrate-binding protein